MIILLFPFLLIALVLLLLTGASLFYLVLGIRMSLQGAAGQDARKRRSGKITILNAAVAFLLLCMADYAYLHWLLTWEL